MPGHRSSKARTAATTAGDAITLNQTDPHYGDTVTFTITTSEPNPWVEVEVFQNGSPVWGKYWGAWDGYDPGITPDQDTTIAWDGNFTLVQTSPLWNPEETAHAVASIVRNDGNTKTVLATTEFEVTP